MANELTSAANTRTTQYEGSTAQSRRFTSTMRGTKDDRYKNAVDAEIIDPHKNLDADTRKNLDEYLGLIREWRSGSNEFINDANAVDENLNRRRELMVSLSSQAVLDHQELSSIRAYVHADKVAITNPDPGEEAYENSRLHRDRLRRSLNLETLRISADEYAGVTTEIQKHIKNEANIEYQRDLIGIRKEVAQENAHNPRFVSEIAVNKNQLFDELLVDLDRGDLRSEDNKTWQESARIRAELFTQELSNRSKLAGGHANSSQKTQAFMRMIEMGKQVSPNPLAVKAFAEAQVDKVKNEKEQEFLDSGLSPQAVKALNVQGELGGKDYEIGIAAMENKKFSKEMMLNYFESIDHGKYLDSRDSHLGTPTAVDWAAYPGSARRGMEKRITKDPVALFRLANASFSKQFDEGSTNAGLSFAVMEYAAQQIMNDPEKMGELAKIDIDAAQAVDQFKPEIRAEISRAEGGQSYEDKIFERMKGEGHLVGQGQKILEGETIQEVNGERVKVNIEDVLNPKSAQFMTWADGEGGLIVAASEEAREAGETFRIGPQTVKSRDAEGNMVEKTEYLSTKGQTDQQDPITFKFNQDGSATIPYGEGEELTITKDNIKPQGQAKTLQQSIKNEGPHIQVLDGGYFQLSASQADAEAGNSVVMSLAGVNIPKQGVSTKDDSLDAGDEAKAHLEHLIHRFGERGMQMETIPGRDGQRELVMRFSNGENVAHRMLRDGYALPSDCEHQNFIREDAARTADRNDRGLWAHGFPENDGSWRRESLMPHLTKKDKRDRLAQTVGKKAMAASTLGAKRILSDRGAQLFSMRIGQDWEHPGFMREAMQAAQSNPDRVMKLYKNNTKLMEELKKKMDKDGNGLTEKEKRAHDQLCVGSRLLGRSLINVGERIDPKTGKKTWKYVSPLEVKKDTETMLSRRGLAVPNNVKEFFKDTTDKVGQLTDQAVGKSHDMGKKVLGVAADLVS